MHIHMHMIFSDIYIGCFLFARRDRANSRAACIPMLAQRAVECGGTESMLDISVRKSRLGETFYLLAILPKVTASISTCRVASEVICDVAQRRTKLDGWTG
jgi:hypothetical protein